MPTIKNLILKKSQTVFVSEMNERMNKRFSRDVIAVMLVDKNKSYLISFCLSCTRNLTFLYCYWCFQRLVENVLFQNHALCFFNFPGLHHLEYL